MRDVGVGALVGLVIFLAAASTQWVVTALAAGVLIGPGGLTLIGEGRSGWSAGVVLVLVAGLLILSRSIWWSSVASRVAAAVTLSALIFVGVVLFPSDYAVAVGIYPVWRDLLVNGGQATAAYAAVGLLWGTIPWRRRVPEAET